MKNRKIQDGEQKIVELIDELLQEENHFNYSRVKQKIKEEKEKENHNTNEERKRFSRTNFYKYVLSCWIFVLMFITCFSLCIKSKSIFYYDTQLSLSIIDNTSVNKVEEQNLLKSSTNNVFAFFSNKNISQNYYELMIDKEQKPTYQCAYLSNEMMKTVNEYFKINNIEKDNKYQQYKANMKLYFGTTLLNKNYIKFSYYLYLNNISIEEINQNLKWINCNDKKPIYKFIDDDALCFVIEIYHNVKAYNIKNNELISDNLKLINYLDTTTSFLNNKVIINEDSKNEIGDKYLYNYELSNPSINYIYDNNLIYHALEVFEDEDIEFVQGILPSIYDRYLENCKLFITSQVMEFEKLYKYVNLLNDGEIKEERTPVNNNQYLIYKYYDYNFVKNYLLSNMVNGDNEIL